MTYKLWNLQVTNAKVQLQVSFGNKDAGFITLSHKNTIDIDCKNNKATFCLLLERSRIYSIGGEAKVGQKFTKIDKLSAWALLEPINSML